MVIVAERSAFPKLAEVFAATPVAVWRDYLTVRYLHAFAAYSAQEVSTTRISLSSARCYPGKNAAARPRRRAACSLLDDTMGEALGKLYVAKYFPPEAKAKARQLVHNLLKAYADDIKTLALDDAGDARKGARKAASNYMPKIGYPDHWRDYSALADRQATI